MLGTNPPLTANVGDPTEGNAQRNVAISRATTRPVDPEPGGPNGAGEKLRDRVIARTGARIGPTVTLHVIPGGTSNVAVLIAATAAARPSDPTET